MGLVECRKNWMEISFNSVDHINYNISAPKKKESIVAEAFSYVFFLFQFVFRHLRVGVVDRMKLVYTWQLRSSCFIH